MSYILTFLRNRLDEDEAVANQQSADWEQTVLEWSGPNDLVARFAPTRVLAEVTAKRRIIERAQFVFDNAEDLSSGMGFTLGAETALRDTVRDLALPYADHPDYDPAWNAQ